MIAIVVGFCGILVAVRPGAEAFEPAFILAFLCMISYAFFIVSTRHLSGKDSSETTLFYSLFAGTYFVAPFAFVDWVWPEDRLTFAVIVCDRGFWRDRALPFHCSVSFCTSIDFGAVCLPKPNHARVFRIPCIWPRA